jgi:hypothetical protein
MLEKGGLVRGCVLPPVPENSRCWMCVWFNQVVCYISSHSGFPAAGSLRGCLIKVLILKALLKEKVS